MKLLVDGTIFEMRWRGGISRVYTEILPRILEHHPDIEPRLALQGGHGGEGLGRIEGLRAEIPDLSADAFRPWRVWRHLRPVVNRAIRRRHVRRWAADVFHPTYYTRAPGRVPGFSFAYDLTVDKYPELFTRAQVSDMVRRKRDSLKTMEHVLCISENTRRDVIEVLKIPEDRCRVVYLAPFVGQGRAPVVVESVGSRPFLLYVGDFETPYKNFRFLLQCLDASPCDGAKDLSLVVACHRPPRESSLQAFHALLGPERLQFLVDIGDDQLADLYARCSALVYPSLYEGFGIPIVEALAHGAPVVCSSTSSLPEAGGAVSSYFDPSSRDSFFAALDQALAAGRAAQAVARRTAWAGTFSWDRTAAGFAEACRLTQRAPRVRRAAPGPERTQSVGGCGEEKGH